MSWHDELKNEIYEILAAHDVGPRKGSLVDFYEAVDKLTMLVVREVNREADRWDRCALDM